MSYTTLWEIPDGLWEQIERILPREKGSVGRPALPNRQVVNEILFVLRSGCQWKGLKKEGYGASSSLHKRFQTWNEAGLWKKIYRMMVKYYHKKRHIQWRWQAVDSKMVPAPLGGNETGPNPTTDRAKSGSKRHLWVDQHGAPLSIHITSANAHNITAIMNLLNRPIVRRPKTKYKVHHLCACNAYDSESLRTKLCQRKFIPHIREREYNSDVPPPLEAHKYPARRWVVERTGSCLNDFRFLRVRWAKKSSNWLALIYFACILILWRMCSHD